VHPELLDILLVILVLVGALSGYRQGAVAQALGLIGAGAGAACAVILLPDLAAALPPLDRYIRSLLVLAFLLTALVVGQAAGSMVAMWAMRGLGRGPLAMVDRIAGVAVGVAQVALVVWFLAPILAVGPSATLADQIDRSALVSVVRNALPPPGPVLGRLRAFLDPSGIPQVFQLFDAPLGTPVPTPPDAVVAALGRAASASTVAVEGNACGLRLTGTGFAVAPDYIVTNAHVVAGERTTGVVTTDGTRAGARVVFYDPSKDVALLYAPGVDLPALALGTGNPAAGTVGVALGHPGGGALALIPAAVSDVFSATGYDIYGRNTVTRVVIELSADVQGGDSGGPFVAQDGRVAGVVFARGRTGIGTGYALDASEVRSDIEPYLASRRAVSTGACAP
jgi:S1-C subfamily serine protease